MKEQVNKIANEILNTRILTVAQVLRRDSFLKKAKTIDELINQTSKKSLKYKSGCAAALQRATPKIGRWFFSVKCGERWSKGPYDVRFRILKGERLRDVAQRQIETSCNCNAWKYNGADYNALKKEYSERQYSDGSAPKVRDKSRRYLICKHVAACIPIFSKYIIPKNFK
jgi:hypothetical protein